MIGDLTRQDRYEGLLGVGDAAPLPDEATAAALARDAAAARLRRSPFRPAEFSDASIDKINTGLLSGARAATSYIENMTEGARGMAQPPALTEEDAWRQNWANDRLGQGVFEYIRGNLPLRLGPVSQAEARGGVLFANPRARRRPMYSTEVSPGVEVPEGGAPGALASPANYGLGHNKPPPEASLIPPPATPAPSYSEWQKGLPRPAPAARSTDLPDIRSMPVDEAIAAARKQGHLIRAGEQSEGYYVGGPRTLESKAGLNKLRRDFDAYVAADPRGGDWYERYRPGISGTTTNTPAANEWASKMHGQWSAGVDPGSEAHFVLKELNSAIAGTPTRANYPAQHQAFQRALAANDPNQLQLGDKTGEYADLVNPDQPFRGATGVNDFRYARQWSHTEPGGEPQKGALTEAQHRFLDHETALAVDRANQANLGGRSDWTGEQLQAAPWVRQKALDLMSRNKNLTYEDAMARAMRTIVDYFPRHTYFATHEAQPGANVVGHMAESVNAPQSVKDAFALDPRSRWDTAPGGRDAIYSGLNVESAPDVGMRVLPSQPMQGFYTRPDGTLEVNLGAVARPLGTFNTPRVYDKEFIGPRENEPFKRATDADRSIMNASEAVRAYLDAQNAAAWHKLWFGGPAKESTSLFFPRSKPATVNELVKLRAAGSKHGLTDVADTGEGITLTQFGGAPPGGKDFDKALRKGEFDEFGEATRARVDSDYIDYVGKWNKAGSGEATRHMLSYINQTPELRSAFNRNEGIAQAALARFDRDKEWAARWGAPRQDIQNAREIIGQGAGWVDRLEAALKAGAILPATAAAIFAAAVGFSGEARAEP